MDPAQAKIAPKPLAPTPVTDHQRLYWKYEYDVAAKYMIPLLQQRGISVNGSSVVDIGCGEGGGLCAFRDAGARSAGFDIDRKRIGAALTLKGSREITFAAGDLYDELPLWTQDGYDLLYMHDVFEHLEQKQQVLMKIQGYMKSGARLLVTFPPYYSAYGAHQQLLKARLARAPFFHLFPFSLSTILPRLKGETPYFVEEVQKLGRLRMGMTAFEQIVRRSRMRIIQHRAYLISPNHIRFGLRPVEAGFLGNIPVIREFLCTGVVYLLSRE